MNNIVLKMIIFYQKYISPYKGFSCAFRLKTGCLSCSTYGKKVFSRFDFFTALKLLNRRFIDCSWANNQLKKVSLNNKFNSQRGFIDCDCGGCDAPDFGDMCDFKGKNCLNNVCSFADCSPDFGRSNEVKEKRFKKNDKKYKKIQNEYNNN